MKFNSLLTACALSSVIVLSSCGGGDDGGTSKAGTKVELTGQFIDSPVAGLRYFAGSNSGITDANGNYKYNPGDTVSFYIGDILIGDQAVPATGIVTPISVIKGATDINDAVINVARLLQSFDNNNNPVDGIVIDPTIEIAAKGFSKAINYSVTTANFTSQTQVILDAISAKAKLTVANSLTLTSRISALNHLTNTIQNQRRGNYSGTFTGDGTGIWEITVNGTGRITKGCLNGIAAQSITGIVGTSGAAKISGLANGASFSGNFSISGSVSGKWSDSTPASGTFSGNKTSAPISC